MEAAEVVRRMEQDPSRASALVGDWFSRDRTEREIVELAKAIARAYIQAVIPFLWANAAISKIMILREWDAPAEFWKVFVAFEDLEVFEDPGMKGIEHVRAAVFSEHT